MEYFTSLGLVSWARENSSFYEKLYSHLDRNPRWDDIPIIDHHSFWSSNCWKENKLLTNQTEKGVLFKSGGTTGKPKFSYYSTKEWHEFCRLFGSAMGEVNLEDGDRVGNMFYAGELYASFLFIQKSLELCPREIIEFPFAGKTPFVELVSSIKEFNINVLCGVPTSFLQFANYCLENKLKLPIEKLLYGGEALYSDQEGLLQQAFPYAKIHSVGYASVDGGMLGRRSRDCTGGEHRVFAAATVMEIIDEEGKLIQEPGREGRLLLTNLTRKLMPIIRYPVGDQAEWVEVGEKFKICGRSQEGARVGPITFNRDDLVAIFEIHNIVHKISHFQMVITHFKGLDCLEIKIVERSGQLIDSKALEKVFYTERTMFKKLVLDNIVHPVFFNICVEEDLFKNERTGKSPVIVDRRLV